MTSYTESVAIDAGQVPVLSGLPIVGVAPQLHKNAMQYLSDTVSRYGHRVKLRVFGRQVLLLSDPADLEVVFLYKEVDFGKSAEVRKLRPVFGDGLYSSEGERWRRQRRVIQPEFNHDQVLKHSAKVVELMKEASSKWRDGETRDMFPDMLNFTTNSICKVLFGELQGEDVKTTANCSALVFENLRSEVLYLSLWRKLPLPRSRRWNHAVETLDRTIYRIIAQRRRENRRSEDLLGALIGTTYENGEPMPDDLVHDEVITMFLAGQETSAVALSWAIALLAEHPKIQEEAAAEVASVTNGREVKAEDYPRLKFIHYVVQETLRLYPPLWSLGRIAVRDTMIRDLHVRTGTDIWVPVREIHRDPQWFSDPHRFDPYRWNTATQRPKYSYFPFGGGPRSCVAQHFSMAELILGLAVVLSRFRLEVAPGSQIEPEAWLTLRPRNGVLVKLSSIQKQ